MQHDLFDTINHAELDYATALRQQWQLDLHTIMKQGRVPTWVEIDSVLQEDEYRLLDLIESHCGYYDRGTAKTQHGEDSDGLFTATVERNVKQLTIDAGFTADGNALAVVNRCIQQGWITRTWDASEQCSKLELTMEGRWAKDMCDTGRYWDGD